MNKKLLYNLVAAFLIILLSISINSILVLILTDNKIKDLKSISKKLSDFSLFTLPHETHGNDFIKMKYFNTDISTSRFSNLFKTIIIQV
jgi:hypothetical protein